ncbi:flagellar motor protein MotB [Candidatus Aerophobetes bacterium]|nr:flagellar motor protein MotB [Candidatus Aerophobetes bacterium]
MNKIKEDTSDQSKDPGWLTTFGDTMSLLLTFFVMLFATLSFEEAKVEQAMGSLKGSLGVMEKAKQSIIPQQKIIRGRMERISEEIKRYARLQGFGKDIKVNNIREGIRINLKSPMLFDLGKAELKNKITPLLDEITALLKNIPNNIRIEGHTDNLPIHTKEFPSNWELSTARAINIGKYFIKRGITPSRLGVIGYADSRPLFPNDTSEHRALNRRVEIFILKEASEKPPESSSEIF